MVVINHGMVEHGGVIRELAQSMAAKAAANFDLLAMRRDYHVDFMARVHRASAKYPVKIHIEQIAGRDCLVVQPLDAVARSGLYFFGGGYVAGAPIYELTILAQIAATAKARIYVPDYPLAPEAPFPAAFDHACAVYRACFAKGMFLAGESAGGGLALAVAQHAVAQGWQMPNGLALFSPWVDMTSGYADVDDPSLDQRFLAYSRMAYAGKTPPSDPRISPIFGEMSGLPPTIMSTGSRDKLRDGVMALRGKMHAANVAVTAHDWQGLWHVFEFYDEIPQAGQSIDIFAQFLQKHT